MCWRGGQAGRCGLPQAQMESQLIFLLFLLTQELFIASQSWAEMVSPKPCLVCRRNDDRKCSPLGEAAVLGLWKRGVQLPLLRQGPCKTPSSCSWLLPSRDLSLCFYRDAQQLQCNCYRVIELRWATAGMILGVVFPLYYVNCLASPGSSAYTWIQVQEVYLGGDTWRGKEGSEEVRRRREGSQEWA